MEIVDNAIMLAAPGAMEAGLADLLFWASLALALLVAAVAAFLANRWLVARGRGHRPDLTPPHPGRGCRPVCPCRFGHPPGPPPRSPPA